MFTLPQLVPLSFSLLATLSWGISDFVGGYGSRRTNPFLLTTFTHVGGATLMLLLAWLTHATTPTRSAVAWSIAAGVSGGISLAIFYKALSMGSMGLIAPVAALIGAAIPTLAGIYAEGVPGAVPIAGFVLAGIGIWLISRHEGDQGRPAGLGLAALSGIGFAGFFLFIKQAGDVSALWAAGVSRLASLLATGTIVLATRQLRPLTRAGILLGLFAGVVDSTGSALFVRASQTGRLDAAVVISSLYPAVTVLLARFLLEEHFSRWKLAGLVAAVLAVPMISC
jgi:drug/metabolite transporter (DMT)-like permease